MFFICLQIKALHQYDCLRANKSTSAWGLEARVPFLDKEFINVAMSIDPEWKMVKNAPIHTYIQWTTKFLPWFHMVYHPSQIKPDEGKLEKWILRRAFDDEEHPYLPKVCIFNPGFIEFLFSPCLKSHFSTTAAYSLQAKRTIQRWRGLQLDWWAQSSCWTACMLQATLLSFSNL